MNFCQIVQTYNFYLKLLNFSLSHVRDRRDFGAAHFENEKIMTTRTFRTAFVFVCSLLFGVSTFAQNLSITYGSKGVQTLSFGSTVLEDVGANPADLFHIWHMRSIDLQGNVVSSGEYGWGESNNGESWNASTKTESYTFSWGSISIQFVQSGNTLNSIVTEMNNAGSGVIFDGAEIYPFALHFPQDPTGFFGYTQYVITTLEPGVSAADFGTGVVTSVIPNEAIAMYGGWKADGTNTYTPIMTSTAPDGLATFLPSNNVPVQPGSSFTYTVSLRFTPEGSSASASDAYASFASTYPSQMTWTDKRIIGTAYLASSPAGTGDITQPGGYPTNPRRYFNDPSVDMTTPAGLKAFQDRMLAQATANAANAASLNAQGVVTWDIEGEQYPQTTSYVCSPDQIAAVAPEMESAILDVNSPYFGQKLDDAYFKIMTHAGLRVGLCLRPQAFTLAANGTASQVYLTGNSAIIANLEAKARYANTRWGATFFYVDSTVDVNGGTLDPAIFQQLITDLPAFLFIPEESTPRYYAYSAPFYSFIFHTTTGTPASTYVYYPNAFGANLVNDVSASTLATYQAQLTQAVKAGDILMGHADYWQANDPTLVAIYQAAGVTGPTTTQSTPLLTWSAPAAIAYGTALSTTQLDAVANVGGTFTYTPAVGTIPAAGTQTLLATFTPTNTTAYKSATASVPLSVTQATPVITWSSPAGIAYGSALGSAQLNAAATVAGTFSYLPGAGTVLAAGSQSLSATFTPADAIDYKAVTVTTSISVAPAMPSITWANPAAISFGTALGTTQLNASSSVAGTFVYSPALGTVLAAGTHTLTATFKPTLSADYLTSASTVSLVVAPVAPTIVFTVANHRVTDAPFAVAATSNSPGAITYSVVSGPATISGSTVTLTGTGSVVLRGSEAAGGSFVAATKLVAFTVTRR